MTRKLVPAVFSLTLVLAAGPAARAIGAAGAPAAPQAGSGTPPCIAIAPPSVRGVEGDATQMSKSLSEMFASYLNGPSLKSIPLEARLADQAIEEAKQKSCGTVLLSSFERKRSGGGALSKAAAAAAQGAAWTLPYSGVAVAGARSAAVAGAYAVSSIAQGTHAKDELIVEYRIGTAETVQKASPKKESLKAKSNGEDLVTPLVEKVSGAAAASVKK